MKTRIGMVAMLVMLCATAQAYSVKSKTITIKRPTDRYEASATYPILKGLKDKSVEASLNQVMKAWVDARTSQYDKQLSEMKTEGSTALIPGGNMLNITYAVKVQDETLLGISWDVYQNFVGSAHPLEVMNPVMYNLETGKVIALADIFKPGAPYLKRLSQICRERLTASFENSGFELFEDGLKPVPENFANFLMRPEGLYFVFNPYQVAPYVAGIQEVVVPYAQIRDLMRSQIGG